MLPPINLDVTGHEKPSQSDEKLPSYALRLIRRLLNIADADHTNVPFKDKDMLEEHLSGTSLDEIAHRKNLTRERIRQRVSKALDFLGMKMSGWEKLGKQLDEMGENLKRLREDALDRDKQIAQLTELVHALTTENDHLSSIVKAYSEKQPKLSQELTKVDEKTRAILESDLKAIGVPPTVAVSFAAHNIHTVIDIIRYTDRQFSALDGISDDAVVAVRQALDRHGLQLGTDIDFVILENEYYIYP